MNNYTKLFADLVIVDVEIEEEDKMVILLNYLFDEEYETFVLTLINGKQTLNYSNVSCSCKLRSEEEGQVFFQKYFSRSVDDRRQKFQ